MNKVYDISIAARWYSTLDSIAAKGESALAWNQISRFVLKWTVSAMIEKNQKFKMYWFLFYLIGYDCFGRANQLAEKGDCYGQNQNLQRVKYNVCNWNLLAVTDGCQFARSRDEFCIRSIIINTDFNDDIASYKNHALKIIHDVLLLVRCIVIIIGALPDSVLPSVLFFWDDFYFGVIITH